MPFDKADGVVQSPAGLSKLAALKERYENFQNKDQKSGVGTAAERQETRKQIRDELVALIAQESNSKPPNIPSDIAKCSNPENGVRRMGSGEWESGLW